MKSNNTELTQRYMVLVKIDASNLFNRIKERQHEYVEAFSLKRDRAIFENVFKCRYQDSTLFDLSHLPIEVIEVTNDFYTVVDELHWYLMNTQDMPNTIEDEIFRYIHGIERKYEGLCLYIDAELGGDQDQLEVSEESAVDAKDPIVEAEELDSSKDFFISADELQGIDNHAPDFEEEDDS